MCVWACVWCRFDCGSESAREKYWDVPKGSFKIERNPCFSEILSSYDKQKSMTSHLKCNQNSCKLQSANGCLMKAKNYLVLLFFGCCRSFCLAYVLFFFFPYTSVDSSKGTPEYIEYTHPNHLSPYGHT